MIRKIQIVTLAIATLAFTACNNQTGEQSENEESTTPKTEETAATGDVIDEEGLIVDILTKEEQDALTPDEVIRTLKDGNARFMNNDLTKRNHSEQIRMTTMAQYPKAIVLSCVDSRVPVEDVFDRGIGDLFVARVAGNFVNTDILGSMEFACNVSGSKLILVMGHEHCGAVKAAVDDVKLGNITPMLEKIKPAIASVNYEGEKNSKNQEYVHMVCESNVRNTINEIRKNSPILKEMEDNGEIKIVGAVYDMDNGQVAWLDEE